MSEPAMALARRLAREQKLCSIRYFDAEENIGARGNAVTRVELQFSNGVVVSLTPQELAMLKSVKFNLRAAPPKDSASD